ncbi:TRAM domain-containing protein [Candidatus Saccharibacteria bacterium]|nr:TRAM domain-containing protein [Candidatus Saccharibacteria bacterium]
MEIFILIIVLLLLAETSVIFARSVKKTSKQSGRRKIYIDTSTLIDGRIVDVAKTGFIGDDLYIPRSVIRELQLLADGKDKEKRESARRGMDNVSELERVIFCNVSILQDELDRTPVDERLITLAKTNHGAICTNDYNLNKVATTEGIDVLNINDLSLALQNDYYPGKHLVVKITGQGSNKGQGVGHLDNGIMVVVDNAAKSVGREIEVETLRFVQNSAGRMIFGKRTKKTSRKK